MPKYKRFSDKQISVANQVNLEEFLKMEGEELIRSGRDVRWKRHSSITIRGNRWYDWKNEAGGYPIAFFKRFYNYSFQDAMELLLSRAGDTVSTVTYDNVPKKEFILPEKNENMKRVYGYLINSRFIDRDVINEFVRRNLIYEDREYHNAVFVGYDEDGTARHAHKKSTIPNSKESYRGNVAGSDPRYTFHYSGISNRLFVFEAPIDMLSFITLNKDSWKQHSYIALNGLGTKGLEQFLSVHRLIEEIKLCLDHDIAGIEGAERISDIIESYGKYQVAIIRPVNKDFNEDIKELNGRSCIACEENPRYTEAYNILNTLKSKSIEGKFNQRDIESSFAKIYYLSRNKKINAPYDLDGMIDDLIYRIMAKQRDLIDNKVPLEGESIVWEYLRDDYRSYRDHGNLERNIKNIAESMMVLKEKLNNKENIKEIIRCYRKLASDVFYMKLNIRREIKSMEKIKQEYGLSKEERPKAKLIGEDGNIFNLMGIASRVLEKSGYRDEAKEMIQRITTTAHSYDEALNIISQYVEPVGDGIDMEETEYNMKWY